MCERTTGVRRFLTDSVDDRSYGLVTSEGMGHADYVLLRLSDGDASFMVGVFTDTEDEVKQARMTIASIRSLLGKFDEMLDLSYEKACVNAAKRKEKAGE